MKNVGNKRYLESFKIFPYIAWGLVIVFAFFVYGITQDLRTVTKQVSANTSALQTTLSQPIETVTDFEN